ncbi:MAG: O-antigen ligase family protein [Planctomycetota bacterium]
MGEAKPKNRSNAIFFLVLFLLSPSVGFLIEVALNLTGGAATMVKSITFMPTFFIWLFRKPVYKSHSLTTPMVSIMAIAIVLTGMSVIKNFSAPVSTLDAGSISLVVKFILLAFFYMTAIWKMRCFSTHEVCRALAIWCLLDMGISFILYFGYTPVRDWNPNSLSLRLATAGFVGMAMFKLPLFRIGMVALAVGMPFALRCRTAFLAITASYMMIPVERFTLKRRSLLILGLILGTIPLMLFATDLAKGGKDLAKRSLGSSNPVIEFFLFDKTADRIDDDFLNRRERWEKGAEIMLNSPLFGVGMGNELFFTGRLRSHNAYLSCAIEIGIPACLAWIVLYVYGFFILFKIGTDLKLDRTDYPNLHMLAVGAMTALLLSSIPESSGFFSLSTPTNLVALVAMSSVIWAAVHRKRQNRLERFRKSLSYASAPGGRRRR